MYSSNRFQRRFFKRVENLNEESKATKSNEAFTNYKDESFNRNNTNNSITNQDYREAYIKADTQTEQTNNQSSSASPNDDRTLIQENSMACISISDFELNNLNATTTTFLSPSTNFLSNDNIQTIQETSFIKPNPIQVPPGSSLLVRAYSQQEKNKISNNIEIIP